MSTVIPPQRALVAVLLLAFNGCAQASPPRGPALSAQPTRASSSSGDLIYAGTPDGGYYVITYPGAQIVQVLQPAIGSGYLCSDGSGDVFIPAGGNVYEYVHGGTEPVNTLQIGADLSSCAVDAKTGNLAVTILTGGSGKAGYVDVFTGGQGQPIEYTDPDLYYYDFCTYDDSGNLYVDGGSGLVAELPYGSSSFMNITLKRNIGGGQMQWDGHHITTTEPPHKYIYRLSFSGSTGRVLGTTRLRDFKNHQGWESWIAGSVVFIPSGVAGQQVGWWTYPSGKPLGSISGLRHIVGVTFSAGSKNQAPTLANPF